MEKTMFPISPWVFHQSPCHHAIMPSCHHAIMPSYQSQKNHQWYNQFLFTPLFFLLGDGDCWSYFYFWSGDVQTGETFHQTCTWINHENQKITLFDCLWSKPIYNTPDKCLLHSVCHATFFQLGNCDLLSQFVGVLYSYYIYIYTYIFPWYFDVCGNVLGTITATSTCDLTTNDWVWLEWLEQNPKMGYISQLWRKIVRYTLW